MWIVDGNNVMGAGADGWWADPTGAATRVADAVGAWCRGHGEEVLLEFDRLPPPPAPASGPTRAGGGNLTVEVATRSGRDVADDRIVEIVEGLYADEPDLKVVTSDRGLIARLPPGVVVESAGRFRERVGLSDRRRA